MTQTATSEVTSAAAEGRLTWVAPTLDLSAANNAEVGLFGQTDGSTGTS
jgi:hypothetical protein